MTIFMLKKHLAQVYHINVSRATNMMIVKHKAKVWSMSEEQSLVVLKNTNSYLYKKQHDILWKTKC